MELKDIAEKINGITESVKTAVDSAKTDINKNVDEKIKATQEALEEKVKGAKEIAEKAVETVEKLEAKQATQFSNLTKGKKSFFTELGEKLSEKADKLKEYKETKKGFTLDMDSKAVGNMASATSLTGDYFVTPQQVPGLVLRPYETVHMRDLLPVGQTNSNMIRFVQDNGGEGGPTMVAEGGTKPQIDRDLEIKDSPVRKIATYFRVPEEMIEDIPYLQSFLAQIGVEEVMAVEDTQILYGDGTGQNLTGIHTTATAFAAGTSVVGASSNEFDVLRAAKKQLRVAKFNPTVALISPVDYFNMTSKKDTANNYLFIQGLNGNTRGVMVDGLQIVEHNSITAGDFIVGDPRNTAIFDRAGTSVRLYDQDQDNAILNLITIVIEKRLALVNYRPTAWVKGTFSAAITDLTS
jgi:HK97 family phage major capsid protein